MLDRAMLKRAKLFMAELAAPRQWRRLSSRPA
jgi:hypothetical protein